MLNPVPLIVTIDPITPDAGVKLVIVGGAGIVKFDALAPLPAAVVTEIGPVVAPSGTIAMKDVAEP